MTTPVQVKPLGTHLLPWTVSPVGGSPSSPGSQMLEVGPGRTSRPVQTLVALQYKRNQSELGNWTQGKPAITSKVTFHISHWLTVVQYKHNQAELGNWTHGKPAITSKVTYHISHWLTVWCNTNTTRQSLVTGHMAS